MLGARDIIFLALFTRVKSVIRTHHGYEIDGFNLDQAPENAQTFQMCIDACVDNPNCVAVTWNLGASNRSTGVPECLLKTNASALVISTSAKTAVVRNHTQVHQGGRYGVWVKDTFELPTYVYQMDQLADRPGAVPRSLYWSGTPISTDDTARATIEHVFMLGNSRIVLSASNFGSVRVRQDEGSPKWLNDATASSKSGKSTQFGAGIGFVLPRGGGTPLATTYYTGGKQDRIFGIGYTRTTTETSDHHVLVDHTISVPYGDDPVVLIEVTLTASANLTGSAIFTYAEVMGSFLIHLDPPESRTSDRRNFSATHYNSSFSRTEDRMLHSRRWLGLTREEQDHFENEYLKGQPPLPRGASMWDVAPPEVFFSAVHTTAPTSFSNDASSFFGRGGPTNASGTLHYRESGLPEQDAAMIASTDVTLRAGQTIQLGFIYGYAPSGSSDGFVDELLQRYSPLLRSGDMLRNVTTEWSKHLVNITMPSYAYIQEEMMWHSYYVQASATYDSFFEEHILDQGTTYRYSLGFQGAARDPVQHALALLEVNSDIAKSVLRYTLKEMRSDFHSIDPKHVASIPYAMVGHGITMPDAWRPDDLDLYVLLLATSYLEATKDFDFLAETVGFYDDSSSQHTVLEALQRTLHFVVDIVGTGRHNLTRLLTSDWDDIFTSIPSTYNISESVLTAGLATTVLRDFASILDKAGDSAGASKARTFGQGIAEALLRKAFNGQWLRRAWLGNASGWAGDTTGFKKGMYAPQHGWAFRGGVFDNASPELDAVLASLQSHCREGWNYGLGYECDAVHGAGPPGPESGFWPALTHPAVIGLLAVNRSAVAWEEFQRDSLNWQATVSPELWSGVWTSADTISNEGLPGIWTDSFPAFCVHRHAWPLVSVRHLAGIIYTPSGVIIRPGIPAELGPYTYFTTVASIAWDGVSVWSGHYSPKASAQLSLAVDLGATEQGKGLSVEVLRADTTCDGRTIKTSKVFSPSMQPIWTTMPQNKTANMSFTIRLLGRV